MENTLLTFRKFNSLEQAQPLIDVLTINGIPYLVEDETLNYDPTSLNGTSLQKTIVVKIKPSEFISTEELLTKHAHNNLENVDKDHYLFNFTNEELMEILMKPDEWSPLDFELSKKILLDRGQEISPEQLEAFQKERLINLRNEVPHQHFLIYFGYCLALLGGFGGILIGWYLMTSKKKLPDGSMVLAFNNEDRTHGKFIFIIGAVAIPVLLYLRFQNEMQHFYK